MHVNRGTIQGDALSPFLFLVFCEPGCVGSAAGKVDIDMDAYLMASRVYNTPAMSPRTEYFLRGHVLSIGIVQLLVP